MGLELSVQQPFGMEGADRPLSARTQRCHTYISVASALQDPDEVIPGEAVDETGLHTLSSQAWSDASSEQEALVVLDDQGRPSSSSTDILIRSPRRGRKKKGQLSAWTTLGMLAL